MQWSLFLLILMGQWVFITCRLYRYHFVDDDKTWKEAQTYCRDEYTDLATVYDKNDMNDMKKLCEKNQDKEAWIGLYSDPNGARPWRWSLPGVEFIEDPTDWDNGEPQNRADGLFVEIETPDLKWRDMNCGTAHHFICYDKRNSSNKFHLIREDKKWPEAQRYCREKHTDLVSGRNQLEDEELTRKISGTGNQSLFWIGLFRDTWKWSDGSSFSFRNWDHWSCPPEKNRCATVHDRQSLQWKTGGCDEKKNFFCYEDRVILIQQNKTWNEALEYCRQNHKDLVSITNLKDQRWVQDRAKNASSPFVWLGLRYTCTLGFWFWVSDETVRYNYWASDVGNDDCNMSGAMERGGEYMWYKKDDTDKFNFICSKF